MSTPLTDFEKKHGLTQFKKDQGWTVKPNGQLLAPPDTWRGEKPVPEGAQYVPVKPGYRVAWVMEDPNTGWHARKGLQHEHFNEQYNKENGTDHPMTLEARFFYVAQSEEANRQFQRALDSTISRQRKERKKLSRKDWLKTVGLG